MKFLALLTILPYKSAEIIETKLASVSVCCKSHRFKTANIKLTICVPMWSF